MIDKIKKRKVSKKTKKSWRKHVDTKDMDAFLDDRRLEERLGLSLSERDDSQLFTIDKTVDTAKVVNSKQAARLVLKNKEARCFASLQPHTQVPDPISKRNRVRTKEERMSSILQKRETERKLKGILKLKEKEALKNRALARAASANRFQRGDFKDDIWGDTNNLLPDAVIKWMSSDSIRHTVKHLGVQKRKLPSSLHKKLSVVPSIEAPHPGISYNPSYADHQQLLNQITEKELELMKEEEHLNRVTSQMFRKVPLNKKDEYMIEEMSEGLSVKNRSRSLNSLEKVSKEEEDPSVVTVKSKPVKNIKKTLPQRRKQREQRKAVNERALAKLEKKKVSDMYKLKVLQKEIETKEKKEEFLRQKRMKKRERMSTAPKVLSKIKFEPVDPDYQLSEELTGNLRNCVPSKSLLKDRYKSLQQRNIIAPAVIKLTRDKAKVKKFVKPDHKINLQNLKVPYSK